MGTGDGGLRGERPRPRQNRGRGRGSVPDSGTSGPLSGTPARLRVAPPGSRAGLWLCLRPAARRGSRHRSQSRPVACIPRSPCAHPRGDRAVRSPAAGFSREPVARSLPQRAPALVPSMPQRKSSTPLCGTCQEWHLPPPPPQPSVGVASASLCCGVQSPHSAVQSAYRDHRYTEYVTLRSCISLTTEIRRLQCAARPRTPPRLHTFGLRPPTFGLRSHVRLTSPKLCRLAA